MKMIPFKHLLFFFRFSFLLFLFRYQKAAEEASTEKKKSVSVTGAPYRSYKDKRLYNVLCCGNFYQCTLGCLLNE